MSARSAAAATIDRLEPLRGLVPQRHVPTLVRRRIDKLWQIEAFRDAQFAQMRYLLEFTDRTPEIPQLARAFAEHTLLRTYVRWHPEDLVRQEVRGIEWLTTRRDPARSVILSFMHHNWYEGLFASLNRAGARITVLASPKVLGPETPRGLRQHIRVVQTDADLIPAVGGTDFIQAQLQPGMIMGVASDVPGHTEVRFLGRRVLASFGAPLIATRTDSQVVPVTARRDGDGSYLQVHEPLEPGDFADPRGLLDAMLRIQEEAVLAWPEVLEMPRARWGIIEE